MLQSFLQKRVFLQLHPGFQVLPNGTLPGTLTRKRHPQIDGSNSAKRERKGKLKCTPNSNATAAMSTTQSICVLSTDLLQPSTEVYKHVLHTCAHACGICSSFSVVLCVHESKEHPIDPRKNFVLVNDACITPDKWKGEHGVCVCVCVCVCVVCVLVCTCAHACKHLCIYSNVCTYA